MPAQGKRNGEAASAPLIYLELTLSNPTDRDLVEAVKQADQLRWVILRGTRVTPEGLDALRRLPSLVSLFADGALVSDAGVRALDTQPSLRFARLEKGGLTDQGVGHFVANAPNLRNLSLPANPGITSTGAAEIAKLTRVRYVDLSSTSVDDDGLLAIAQCKPLNELRVLSSKVTFAGVEQFKRMRPDVKLNHNAVR